MPGQQQDVTVTLDPREIKYGVSTKSGTLSYMVGSILGLLIIMPLSNGVFWMGQSEVLYFLGVGRVCGYISLASVVPLFVFSVHIVSNSYCHRTLTLVMIGIIFVAVFGIAEILLSGNVMVRAQETSQFLWNDCVGGSDLIQALQAESLLLNGLRNRPECAQKASVDLCADFVWTYEADVLRHMERNLGCSGFCNLNQTSHQTPNMTNPLTLFSRHNHEATCDTLLARKMRDWVAKSAGNTLVFGFLLLIVGIVMCGSLIMVIDGAPAIGMNGREVETHRVPELSTLMYRHVARVGD